jgi:MFS family permease
MEFLHSMLDVERSMLDVHLFTFTLMDNGLNPSPGKRVMITNKNILTSASFTAMFFLGVGTAIIGAASRNIGLSPDQIGYLLGIQNIGFIISVVMVGSLADSVDKGRLMSLASIILALSFFLFYMNDAFILNLGLMLFIGIGIGGYEGASDAMLLDIRERRESFFISVNHFFVTFGELMIVIYLIFLQMDWRKSMVQSGLVVLVLALLFGFARVPPRKMAVDSLRSRAVFLMKQRPVIKLFLMASCAVGIELSMIGMITSFLMDFHGFDQVTSKLGLVTFLAGIAGGRLLLGILVRESQLLHFILGLFALTTVILCVLLFASPGLTVTYILLFVSGMAISVLFPLIITLSGLRYPDMSGLVMGVIKLGIPMGGIVVPFMLSVLVRTTSFRTALVLFPLIAAVGSLIALSSRSQMSTRSALE